MEIGEKYLKIKIVGHEIITAFPNKEGREKNNKAPHYKADGIAKHTPFKIVKQLKGNTSIQLRRCFKHLPYLLWSYGKRFPNLWAKGYYCGSAGHVSQEAVRRYINEQEGKDVFEYSVFGSPNQKIGKFANQTKLGVFL